MRVWVYTHDPMLTLCYSPEQAAELFGDSALEEDGVEVPDALVQDIIETYKRLGELSSQLKKLRDEHERIKWHNGHIG